MLSCKKESKTVAKESEIETEVINKIKNEGFSTNGIIKVEGGYVVEGDIFLSEKSLANKSSSPQIRIAKTEQYRTRNLISVSGTRVITISVTGLPPAYIAAADEAIARYNALNLRLTFQRINSGGNIDIQNADLGPGILGRSAGFPDAQGNPPSPILLNAGYIGNSPDQSYIATIIAHEIGHTIGFRHTDYFNRGYSCGYSNPNDEGDAGVGAINIPGTPTAEDPNSWMLACAGNNVNRPFNTNDQIALRTLYGTPKQVGLGGYDLLSTNDQTFAFDYNSSGKADHLVLYRPGSGLFWVLQNNQGTFGNVYASNQGINGYDLTSTNDQAFAFDYNSSGKTDHLVIYRPGSGILWILRNNNGTFSNVYASNHGIAGYDLLSANDKVFAFDYTGSGKADHLVVYRPGSGLLWILRNNNGTFSNVYASNQGIAGYDLLSANDKVFAFDYTGSGKADHLVVYRPGSGILWILRNNNGTFSNVYASNQGIAGYDLLSGNDKVFTFDYTGSGKADHLVVYRPGSGLLWILRNNNGTFSNVYASNQGIAGYDLLSTYDKVIPFDYLSNGSSNYLFICRPGSGIAWMLRNSNGIFSNVY
ncbi:M57 family metalloprotease [Chitinophaga flava]|nr:M57 family metalloprotease [Chitinophaga flava]